MSKANAIHDAEPEAWREGLRPDPTAAELRHRAAGREYAAACDALEGWTGARDRRDPAYAAVLNRYQAAITEHQAAGRALPQGE